MGIDNPGRDAEAGNVRSSALADGALVVLDRPARRNALTIEIVHALAGAITDAAAAGARAIVLTGAPPVFCAGGDLPQLAAVAEDGASAVSDVIYRAFHGLVRTIADVSVPVIAAVNGPAIGAGLDLALVCDLRLAARDAQFVSSWITVGLVPGMGGAFLLPRAIGSTRAAGALLLGQPIMAEQALSWGLVNEVVDGDGLIERAEQVVATIAALPATAVARTKAAMRRSIYAGFDQELATLGATQGALLTGADFAAAVTRFRR